ncbi:MAG: MBL fold metallo-hydrolase, partial [Eubacterium sp.]|nr:MBL fold metallo-hydrolase [Eubacterium sp.]
LAVFTGDSLVNGHDTITRFPTGNKRVFREETEPYIMSLPDNIVIFPGHGDPARLSEIKEYAII